MKEAEIGKIEIQDDRLVFKKRKDGVKMVFNGRDRRGVPYDILNFGSYDKKDTKVLFSLLEDNAVILDIGANIVWCFFLFSKRLLHSTIYAFEPL